MAEEVYQKEQKNVEKLGDKIHKKEKAIEERNEELEDAQLLLQKDCKEASALSAGLKAAHGELQQQREV